MTKEEHRDRHQSLHRSLDELVADWIEHTPGRPSKNTVLELIKWSNKQQLFPDHDPGT